MLQWFFSKLQWGDSSALFHSYIFELDARFNFEEKKVSIYSGWKSLFFRSFPNDFSSFLKKMNPKQIYSSVKSLSMFDFQLESFHRWKHGRRTYCILLIHNTSQKESLWLLREKLQNFVIRKFSTENLCQFSKWGWIVCLFSARLGMRVLSLVFSQLFTDTKSGKVSRIQTNCTVFLPQQMIPFIDISPCQIIYTLYTCAFKPKHCILSLYS